MAYYSVVTDQQIGESIARTFRRRDAANRYAYAEIYRSFSSGLLASRAAHNAIEQLPDDLRTIPVASCGRKILTIRCAHGDTVTINAGVN